MAKRHFRPDLPDEPFKVTVKCARCHDKVTFQIEKHNILLSVIPCPSCKRWVMFDPDLETWKPWWMVVALAGVIGIAPFHYLDRFLWKKANKASIWLQKAWFVDKYILVLCAFGAAFISMTVLYGIGLEILLWGGVVYKYARWVSTKAGSEDEAEVKKQEDHQIVKESRTTRAFMLGCFFVMPALMWFYQDFLFPISFVFLLLGLYWVDSDHVPPSKRGFFDMARDRVFGSS